jgi:hypothetical protein
MDSAYAIVAEKVLAMCTVEEHQIELSRGMMVEETATNYVKDRYKSVVIHDYYQKHLLYDKNVYLVKSSALLQVPSEIWPYLMAVADPYERANIARDKAFIEYILRLEENNFIAVIGDYFNISAISQSLSFLPEREPKSRTLDYDCIIRYIGPIEELAPGVMFGLELLVNLWHKLFPS